jgi:type I restriction enzyme S subunit
LNNGFPLVPLGEVAVPVQRLEAPILGKTYRQIGVRLWGEGAYEREPVDGGQTKYKALSRVEADDIIVNKIWARNGSVGVVSESLAGSYGSNEFPTFEPIREKLDSRWIHWLTKTKGFWAQCDEKSRGTSGKNRIRPERFLEIKIPLPSLHEQRRIVARIEELAARIEEARGLRRQAVEEAEAFWRSSLSSVFGEDGQRTVALETACEAVVDNLHSTPIYDGDEFACIRSQDVGWGRLNYTTALRTSEAEFIERTRRGEPRAGDIVYVREGDVGRCAVVDGSQRFCLGQRVMMFRPNRQYTTPRYLMYQLRSPSVLDEQVLVGKTGTTSHHVNIKHLRQVRILVPSLDKQRRIEMYLDDLESKCDTESG